MSRYLTDGALDTTFADHGNSYFIFPQFKNPETDGAGISALAIQADGKIIAAGTAGTFFSKTSLDVCVARYLPDGMPDVSFGTGGATITNFVDVGLINRVAL